MTLDDSTILHDPTTEVSQQKKHGLILQLYQAYSEIYFANAVKGRHTITQASFPGTTGRLALRPPSTAKFCPFTYDDSSEARNKAMYAIWQDLLVCSRETPSG